MSQPGGGTGQREPVPTGTLIGAVGRPGEDDRRKRVSDVSDIGAFLHLDVGTPLPRPPTSRRPTKPIGAPPRCGGWLLARRWMEH